jgi:hypothetical protein
VGPLPLRLWAFAATLVFGVLAGGEAWADYYPKLFTGTRANGMGGAFVAVADDEQAIFMNPAGLAGVKGFTFNYAAADIEASWDTVLTGLEGMTAFSELSAETLNILMNKKIFVHTQFTPSLIMPGFGIALISDQQFSLLEQNRANPSTRLGYMLTNGFQVAYGASVLPKRMRTKQDFRVGVAGKLLWRRGGLYDLNVIQLMNLAQAPIDTVHQITGNYGKGYGLDLGFQYLRSMGKRLTLAGAIAMTDLGHTAFADPKAMPQRSNLTWGLAATYNLRRIKVTYAFDYAHTLEDLDFRSRVHTGVELQLPFITLSGGFNQMNLSYGASFDLWMFRITAASYAEELATLGGQNSERRYAARVALKVGF